MQEVAARRLAYRPDIDGLRAIAVIGVLLFHFGVPGFVGGFLGVDVFFVISGFLITQLIASGVHAGHFSLGEFYERRLRRIAPALIAMLLAATAVASQLFIPLDLIPFFRSLVATLFFSSNIYFARSMNYFVPNAETAPLLHTWSLGVEEQFYLTYPLLLVLLLRRIPQHAAKTIWSLLLLSALVYAVVTAYAPAPGFYLMIARLWQLMLGAVLALSEIPPLATRKLREGCALGGLTAIAASFTVCSTPGLGAFLAAGGAALLIHANTHGETFVRRMLSVRGLVFTGLISYSLYLWHWPIIVFARYALLRPPHSMEIMALAALSYAIAVLSWRYVEQPFRSKPLRISRTRILQVAGTAAAVLLLSGVAGLKAKGWPARLDSYDQRIASYLVVDGPITQDRALQYNACYLNVAVQRARHIPECAPRPGKTNILLWGDSHAAHLFPGLHAMTAGSSFHLAQASQAGCPPMEDNRYDTCTQSDRVVEDEAGKFDIIILSARWRVYVHDLPKLERLVARLTSAGKTVIVLGPSPEYQSAVPRILLRYLHDGQLTPLDAGDYAIPESAAVDVRMRMLFDRKPHVAYISLRNTLCPNGKCPLTIDGEPLHRDYGHFTSTGSRHVAQLLWPKIQAAIDEGRESEN